MKNFWTDPSTEAFIIWLGWLWWNETPENMAWLGVTKPLSPYGGGYWWLDSFEYMGTLSCRAVPLHGEISDRLADLDIPKGTLEP